MIAEINDFLINVIYQLLCIFYDPALEKMMLHWKKSKQNMQIYTEKIQLDNFNDEILEIIYNYIFSSEISNKTSNKFYSKIINLYKILN